VSLPELTRRLTEANERIAEFPESVKVRGFGDASRPRSHLHLLQLHVFEMLGHKSWVCWSTPLIPALGRQRQADF
jgi:hypothetical protein